MRYLCCVSLLLTLPLAASAGQEPRLGGKTVVGWLEQLKSGDAKKQLQAIEHLGDFGPDAREAVDELAKVLQDPAKGKVRIQAANALGRIGPAAAKSVAALKGAVADADAELGLRAMTALGNLGPAARDAVPVLVAAARARNPEKALTALAALGRVGVADKATVDVLVETLGDPEEVFRIRAIQALADLERGQLDVRAALLKALADKSDKVFAAALHSTLRWHEAGSLPPGTTEALLHVLLDRYRGPRWYHLRAAEAVAPLLTEEDLAACRDALKDDDAFLALGAAVAVARHDGPSKDVVAVLLRQLKHDEAGVRTYAATALARLLAKGPHPKGAKEAAAALEKMLNTTEPAVRPEPAVRRELAVAVVRLTGGAKQGLPILLEMLEDSEPTIRAGAARSLGELGKKAAEALGPLEEALAKDPSPLVRGRAADALGRLGKVGKAVADLLHELATREPAEPDPRPLATVLGGGITVALVREPEAPAVRLQAAVALLRLNLGGPQEILVIQTALTGRDAAVAAMAIQEIRDLATRQAVRVLVPPLRSLLQSPDPSLRRAAWYALEHLPRRTGVKPE
jgi:HEAT repeat protein